MDSKFAEPTDSKTSLQAENTELGQSTMLPAEILSEAGVPAVTSADGEAIAMPTEAAGASSSGSGGDDNRAAEANNANKKRSNVTKTFGLVALLTVVSKLVGFARDVIVLEVFGTTAVADAYNYALLFTGNVLILFGGLGGPFHSATVAVLSREKDKPESGLLMAQVIAVTGALLSLIAALLFFAAPYLVQIVGKDYAAGNIVAHNIFIDQTVQQLRWMSPLVVIAGLIGIAYGILNVYERIFWPSLSPLIASVAIIIGVKLFVDPHDPSALPLSLATMVGAFGQLLVQIPDLIKCKLPWRFSFKPDPQLKEYLLMLGPACFGTLVGQLTTYVDSMFTGQMPGQGDWTAIVNSNRLVQLPLGILATAMLVPMLPRFSELAKDNDSQGIKVDFKKAFQFLIFLSMPLAALLTALPEPIVAVLFKRGNFTVHSVNLVGEALWWLAPSIMCYLGRDLITRVFYAYKDTRTPFLVAAIAIGIKYLLDWFFITQCHWSVGGISLATSLITVLNLGLLAFFLRKRIGRLGTTTMLKPVITMLVGGLACGAISALLFLGWENSLAFNIKGGIVSAASSSRFAFKDGRVALIAGAAKAESKANVGDSKTLPADGAENRSANPAELVRTPAAEANSPEVVSTVPEESWFSLALGLSISAAIGLAAYFLICLFGKLDELQMLQRRLPGKKKPVKS